MSCTDRRDFCVGAGETFMPVIHWATDTLVSIPITAIAQSAPVSITAPGHTVPQGWPIAVVSAKGMTQINSPRYPPRDSDWHPATVVDANTVAMNNVNSADFSPYLAGGFLVYGTPMNLQGMTAKLTIRDAPDTGAVLATLTETLGIVLDNTAKTIIPRLETAGLAWGIGYYDLEMTDVNGVVVELLSGTITIE